MALLNLHQSTDEQIRERFPNDLLSLLSRGKEYTREDETEVDYKQMLLDIMTDKDV